VQIKLRLVVRPLSTLFLFPLFAPRKTPIRGIV
jgi:hypothetical protein